jgi:DNA-binding MarR family transcriptional regulator
MSEEQLGALRAAFGELMGAERRLRSRDPRKPGELSTGQVRALIQLAKDEQVTAGELAKRAELSPGAMTSMLDQLENEGMITRLRSATDRRQVIVALTERGLEEVAAKRAVWERIWHEGLQGHGDDELEAAARVMRTIATLLDGIGRDT